MCCQKIQNHQRSHPHRDSRRLGELKLLTNATTDTQSPDVQPVGVAARRRRVGSCPSRCLHSVASPLLSSSVPAARGGELKRSAPRSPLSSPLLSSLPLALPSSCVGSKYQTNLPSPSGRRARGASFFGALRRGPFLLSEIIRLDVFASPSPSLSPLPSRLVSCVTACSLSFLVRSSRCLCQRSPLPVPALLPFLV